MLLHTSGYGKHIGIEDYVERIHPDLLSKNTICTLRNFYSSLVGSGLSLFVEAHHHHGSTIAHDIASMTHKHVLTLLERYGVDDTLALHAFESCGDDIPLGGINHNRYARYFGFACHEIEECGHLLARIKQTVVHIDVDHLRSVLHLLACDGESLIIFLFLDKSEELARTSHIASLAHIDKSHFGSDVEQFQSTEPHCRWLRLGKTRFHSIY